MVMPAAYSMSGRTLADRYEIGGRVEGEQLVYRGTDRRGGTPVTVRMIMGPNPPDDAFARLQALVDPRLVRALAMGVQDGTRYLVTELCDGYLLRDELRTGPLAASRILLIGARICDAVAVLHAHDLAHGELSTASVYVAWPTGPDDDADAVKLLPPSYAKAAAPDAIAKDVQACRAVIEAMLEPKSPAPLRELVRAPATTANELAKQCRALLLALPSDERGRIVERPPPKPSVPIPRDIPMPTNWSPPPPPREFSYAHGSEPRRSGPEPSPQPPPQAIVVTKPRRAALAIAIVGAIVVVALLVWILR